MPRARALLALPLLCACLLPVACDDLGAFVCASDATCAFRGQLGLCEASGFCSEPVDATECPSGRRYRSYARSDFAGRCVSLCSGPTDCKPGERCESTGFCSIAADCPSGRQYATRARADVVGQCVPTDTGVWERISANGPERGGAAATFDSTRNVIVLFGGENSSGVLGDTWEWTGAGWGARCGVAPCASTRPPARSGHAMAYDAGRKVTVLYGGTGAVQAGGPALGDTWEWDGAAMAWTLRCSQGMLCAQGTMLPRQGHAMTYDAARQAILAFGGAVGGATTFYSDTWRWDGTSWLRLLPMTSPQQRWLAAVAYDRDRQTAVLFGGANGLGPLIDTWEWDGQSWAQKCRMTPCVTNPPSAEREGAAMAYDSFRKRIVLFGGLSSSQLLNDTWEWDGSVWHPIDLATAAPPARYRHVMAFDATTSRRRTLLFGGFQASSPDANPSADTWLYHTRGGACATAQDCDTRACVDGVCCEQATCGAGQFCNTVHDSGQCRTAQP